MTSTPSSTEPSLQAHWRRWLLAALLVVSQTLLVVHGLHHLGAGENPHCRLCLAGHGLDHASLSLPSLPPSPIQTPIVYVRQIPSWRQTDFSAYASRAPPC